MASSQVEIATFVHNRRDPPTCNFQNNRIEFADLWVHRPQWQTPPPSDSDNKNNNNNNARIHKAHNKWAKAREMVLNVDHKPSAAASPVVTNSGGVSSLLQKWRGFEAKKADPGPTTPTSSIFQMDNVIDAANAHDPSSPSPSPSLYGDVDSFLGDWEPDRAAAAAAAAAHSRKAIEIERLKVSDIVKRLTVSTPRGRVSSSSSSDQSDQQRCPSPVVSSPRIRGRQALNDLLMRIERDRKKELEGIVARKPVSNFSHRGRIQALLRFRFLLRGGMEAKQDCHSNVDSFQTQKAVQRVKPSVQEVVDNTCTAKNESKTSPVKTTDKIHYSTGSVTPKQHDDVGKSPQKAKEATGASVRLCHSYEDLGHAENPFSALIRKRPDWENDDHKQLAKSAGKDKEEEGTNQQVTINDFEEVPSYQKDEPTQELADTASMYWASDRASNPEVEWDEFQSDNQLEGTNREWMYQVSRPRSDWEGLRQERYQEMLDHFFDNEEIRVLLGRKSVSTFLSSSQREKIEQVMVSRVQGGHAQQTPKNDRTKEKEKHEISLSEQVGVSDERDKGEDYNDGSITFDEYEEAYESSVGQQYTNESDDSTDKITTSSWPQNQSSDYSYDHHQIPSPSPQESPSNFYSQSSSRRPDSSDSARPSAIDMELIYDLRGHMEQLHQEMSELRKSIKSCVDMQIELQRSIKKEVATALHRGNSEARNGRRNAMKKVSSTRGRTGGMCCVCHKMPVDSLLYRCGHMCTCFKCAHKLHWSSGKCPICRAPILDVVRTYSNHS